MANVDSGAEALATKDPRMSELNLRSPKEQAVRPRGEAEPISDAHRGAGVEGSSDTQREWVARGFFALCQPVVRLLSTVIVSKLR